MGDMLRPGDAETNAASKAWEKALKNGTDMGEWEGLPQLDTTDASKNACYPGDTEAQQSLRSLIQQVKSSGALIRAALVAKTAVKYARNRSEGDLDVDKLTQVAARLPTDDPFVQRIRPGKAVDTAVALVLDRSSSTTNYRAAPGVHVGYAEEALGYGLAAVLRQFGCWVSIQRFCGAIDGREVLNADPFSQRQPPWKGVPYVQEQGTPLGRAMRAAADSLTAHRCPRKVMIVLTDGQPEDIAMGSCSASADNATAVVNGARRHGIEVLGLGLGQGVPRYVMERVFGEDGMAIAENVKKDIAPALRKIASQLLLGAAKNIFRR